MKTPTNIPQIYVRKYEEIADMIISFCSKENYDGEFTDLCLHALQKLARKKTEPLGAGKNNIWAAGIVYAMAQNCNMIGNNGNIFLGRPKYRLKPEEVCREFSVSKGGVSEKAKAIRKELSITQDKEEWLLPSQREGAATMKTMSMLLNRMKRR